MLRRLVLVLLSGLIVAVSLVRPASAQGTPRPVTIFAAASLKTALDGVAEQRRQATGRPVAISYAASSALARQIEAGAPADIFLPADLDWMDYLAARGLIAAPGRTNLLGNRLALIGPKGAPSITIEAGMPLAKLIGDGRLAMADIAAVPAGKYGKAALESLGLWAGVSGKVAQAENVRAALLLVSRGEAPLGIVYRTDAAADPNVTIVGLFPAASHPPIIYPAALTASSRSPDAAAFLADLRGPQARAIFEAQGFTLLAPPAPSN